MRIMWAMIVTLAAIAGMMSLTGVSLVYSPAAQASLVSELAQASRAAPVSGLQDDDHTRIAYVLVRDATSSQRGSGGHGENGGQYALMISDADGSNPRELLRSPSPLLSPAWSPDNRQIAVVVLDQTGHSRVEIVNIASGARRVVSDEPGMNASPAWSPDGKQLALVLSKTGYPKIYTLQLQGRRSGGEQALKQLTHGWSVDTEPTWAADGRSLFFTSNRGGKPQIYRVKLAQDVGQVDAGAGETGAREVGAGEGAASGDSATAETKSADGSQKLAVDRVTFEGEYNSNPAVSRDGKTLVFQHAENGRMLVASLALEDAAHMRMLTTTGFEGSPSFSPNGKQVLFATQMGGRGVLGRVAIDGRTRWMMPDGEGWVQSPKWAN